MNKRLLVILGFLWLFTNSCRVFASENHPDVGEFPLVLTDSMEIEKVQRIAFSDEWIAVQTPGEITAIDLKTKNVLWKIQSLAPDIDSEFEIVDDNLIFASQDEVFILAKNGERIPLTLNPNQDQLIRLIAVYHSYIYVIRGGDWTLEVYDFAKNSMLWQRWVGRGNTSVFYEGQKNVGFVVTPRGIGAFNNSTGELIWEHKREILHSTINSDTLYLLEQENDVYKISAIDINTQHEKWKKPVSFDANEKIYQMTVLDNLLVLSTRKGVLALEMNSGEVVWQSITGDIFYTKPVLISDFIYARGASNVIYAIASTNGKVKGSLDLSKDSAPPAYKNLTPIYKTSDGIALNTYTKIIILGTR